MWKTLYWKLLVREKYIKKDTTIWTFLNRTINVNEKGYHDFPSEFSVSEKFWVFLKVVGISHSSRAKFPVNQRGISHKDGNFSCHRKNSWRGLSGASESLHIRKNFMRKGGVTNFVVKFCLTVFKNFAGEPLVFLKVSDIEKLYKWRQYHDFWTNFCLVPKYS